MQQTNPVATELEPPLFSVRGSESCVGYLENSGTHTGMLCTSADLRETREVDVVQESST